MLGLFSRQESVTASEMARALGNSPRTVRDLVSGWLADGWLLRCDNKRGELLVRHGILWLLQMRGHPAEVMGRT